MNSYSRVLFKREGGVNCQRSHICVDSPGEFLVKKKKSLRDTAHLIHIFLSHSRPNFKYCTFEIISNLTTRYRRRRIHDFLPKIYVTSCISMQINMNCVRHLLKFPRILLITITRKPIKLNGSSALISILIRKKRRISSLRLFQKT